MEDRNGIPILKGKSKTLENKRGCYTGKCTPSVKPTSLPDQRVQGASLEKLPDGRQSVK